MDSSDASWRITLRVAVALLTTIYWLLLPHSRACQLPMLFDHGVRQGWCWEFWLYRYQTLIGAIVAVGAAVAAWRATRAQTDLSRYIHAHETVANLQRMAMICAVPFITLMLTSNVELIENKCLDELSKRKDRIEFLRRRETRLQEIKEQLKEFSEIALRTPMSEQMQSKVARFRGAVANLRSASEAIVRTALAVFSEGSDDEQAAHLLRTGLADFRELGDSSREEGETVWDEFRRELDQELKRARAAERRFWRYLESE